MVNLEQIIEAHKNISPYINYTPLLRSSYLSRDKNVYLKLESLQITGSFKLRGAINKLLSLNDRQKIQGVIAVSTGNHGKGVAYASNQLGIQSTIFMSKMVPDHRRKAIESLGAKVKIVGTNSDEADLYAREFSEKK
ncbi:pyridoxal-phosphate dependent enzyme [Alphaproteobacteria bacterium]|nr:pyridoxal-phosphate dependent enzyme [Alphaproteobacteria bacterium]